MLSAILPTIHCAAQTTKLFTALGYRPAGEPFDDGVRTVAWWRGFTVIAADDPDPAKRAQALARTLATSGRRALAIAVGPHGIAIAAPRPGASGSTKALVISFEAPTADTIQMLEALRPRSATALEHALRVAEILSTEAVGERFFTSFRIAIERMAGSLDRRHRTDDRRMLALLALTRVLFLYFVQAKGWLDGKPDYLRHLLDVTLSSRRDFHRAALRPLFFGTLNRPPRSRSRRLHFGRIPFLNGGLFEPHAIERRLGALTFSNNQWRDAFDSVFERFRFCVREANDVGAVAPDMLGRVFERLMDEEERHATGSYYTPESLVRQVVDATIESALLGAGGLDHALARDVVARRPCSIADVPRALGAIRKLRMLDPAAGSGAFLLGALESLTEIRLALEIDDQRRRSTCTLRREILRENLFGVDLNPIAVRLAELRLWLAVLADDPTTDIAAVAPLPNLDGVVRQGDALLDPLGAARSFHPNLPSPIGHTTLSATRSARRALFNASGPQHRRTTTQLRRLEQKVARETLTQALQKTEYELRESAAAARNRDLFGRRNGITPTGRSRYQGLQRHRADLLRRMRALDRGTVPFFSFDVHVPDILAAGGFTIVVGNPPWVRAERLPAALRQTLKHRFSMWCATGESGFAHLPDLAIAFLERSLELTAPGGAVGLLVPSKVASAGYGEVARRRLVRETTIEYLHRVSGPVAKQFGATAYPLAIVARKEAPASDHEVRLSFATTEKLRQRSLDCVSGPWILRPDHQRDALEEFLTCGTPLVRVARPALGVKTGADSVFVATLLEVGSDTAVVRFGRSVCQIERSVLRPALRGRDVHAFRAHPTRVVLWGHDPSGVPLVRLPPLAARYIRQHTARLRRRSDDRGGSPWMVFRTKATLAPYRVVWRDIAKRPEAVVLEEIGHVEAVPLNTCYVAPTHDRESALIIAAVLNSTWATAWVVTTADEARGGYRRINARAVSSIPLPKESQHRARLIELSAGAHRGLHDCHAELDEAVADALGISTATRQQLRRLAAHHR